MDIVKVAEWTVDVGGDDHSGWLPKGAATPLATPVRRVDLALAIMTEGGGCTLEWRGPTQDTSGDRWYSSVEEAIADADNFFGIPEDAWAKPKGRPTR
jgi:hypothetical protein